MTQVPRPLPRRLPVPRSIFRGSWQNTAPATVPFPHTDTLSAQQVSSLGARMNPSCLLAPSAFQVCSCASGLSPGDRL